MLVFRLDIPEVSTSQPQQRMSLSDNAPRLILIQALAEHIMHPSLPKRVMLKAPLRLG